MPSTQDLLSDIRFGESQAAHQRLAGIETRVDAPTFADLERALVHTAEPDLALAGMARLVARPGVPESWQAAPERLRWFQSLCTLFAGSHYLGEMILREPALADPLRDLRRLAALPAATYLVQSALTSTASPRPWNELRRWQQRELLRVGAADLLGMCDLRTTVRQISDIADTCIQVGLEIASRQTETDASGLCVLAMGKLGGRELNYSSDIDLVMVAETEPSRYQRLATTLIRGLSEVSEQGFLYRVDMRLRPWGSAGPLVATRRGYSRYLQRDAALWERQALIKARPVAGDADLTGQLLATLPSLIYTRYDAEQAHRLRADVSGMKQRIEKQLADGGALWGEVKRGIGSIRDIEFTTQYLQLFHGHDHPAVRGANTLRALEHLRAQNLLSFSDHRVLSEGYSFLRPIEHYLQLMDDRQTHHLPKDGRKLERLAKRLGFDGQQAGDQLLDRYEAHSRAVRAVYTHHLESDPMPASTDRDDSQPAADVSRHLARLDTSYGQTFNTDEIAFHAELAGRLDRHNPVQVHARPTDDAWRLTLVAYDYPGELSYICGLLFCHGLDIREGWVYSYEPLPEADAAASKAKIVDVFTVVPQSGALSPGIWERYASDLQSLLLDTAAGRAREARGRLARQVAQALQRRQGAPRDLMPPVDIAIDNEASARYTVLRIVAPDTPGFLYELTNALALRRLNVARVNVESRQGEARDTLFLSDSRGNKIEEPTALDQLRAATALVKHFTHLLPQAPDPERALAHLSEMIEQIMDREDWLQELVSLQRPEVLTALARMLGASDYLWDDMLRMQHENLFPLIRDVASLGRPRARGEMAQELAAIVERAPDEKLAAELNAWKDREMFRVDLCHLQGYYVDFGAFSAELSDVAELTLSAAGSIAYRRLVGQHGQPRRPDGRVCPHSLCALGKLGGREIGYASDIELMVLYEGGGDTDGQQSIGNAPFYERMVRDIVNLIQAKREGIFAIDLRLRPYGQSGSLAVSKRAFERYFSPDGPAWPYERQALIRLRAIAGDEGLGSEIEALRDDCIYGNAGPDVSASRAMRERQLFHLVTPGRVNAKFSRGGLVDVEYTVQLLQLAHGGRLPAVRRANTQQALTALHETGVLNAADHATLSEGHLFLRHLIDALRMVRGNARDLTIPETGTPDYASLTRRISGHRTPEQLAATTSETMSAIETIRQRLLAAL